MAKSKRTKATDISQKTKHEVWERDNHRCIFCGSFQAMPNAHALLSRANGGLGVSKNVVTLCIDCHRAYDQGTRQQRDMIGKVVINHLENIYGEISIDEIKYKKW